MLTILSGCAPSAFSTPVELPSLHHAAMLMSETNQAAALTT